MSFMSSIQTGFISIGLIVVAMVVVAAIETIIPLQMRGRWGKDHLLPNLALTFITFATNLFFNAALVAMLIWLESIDFGVLRRLAMPVWIISAIAVLALDFSFFITHIAMHKIPGFWRFHVVHHSDPALDVTTTIRQHPGESVIRYCSLAAVAFALGVSPGAFAIYRVWSVLNGLFEHANIRLPHRLDEILVLLITTPDMHKIHHSREWHQTDSNYGNITSVFDRLFRTYTPSRHETDIAYGLEGQDDPKAQTLRGLLAVPFRGSPIRSQAGAGQRI
jgi:sterol desaturase/sphingolipid hydroxylase (fatty acid hydroxylase superfamily)